MGCQMCDINRRAEGADTRVGDPCDICNGSQYDYLFRPCRHCNPRSPYYAETQRNIAARS